MEILSDPFILNNFITNCPVGGHQCLEDIKTRNFRPFQHPELFANNAIIYYEPVEKGALQGMKLCQLLIKKKTIKLNL